MQIFFVRKTGTHILLIFLHLLFSNFKFRKFGVKATPIKWFISVEYREVGMVMSIQQIIEPNACYLPYFLNVQLFYSRSNGIHTKLRRYLHIFPRTQQEIREKTGMWFTLLFLMVTVHHTGKSLLIFSWTVNQNIACVTLSGALTWMENGYSIC